MIMRRDARAYLKRWRLASATLQSEPRTLSFQEKLRRMDACYRTAAELGLIKRLLAERRRGEREVRIRWRRLKGLAA